MPSGPPSKEGEISKSSEQIFDGLFCSVKDCLIEIPNKNWTFSFCINAFSDCSNYQSLYPLWCQNFHVSGDPSPVT
jgi:hypothetical protein